MPSASLDATAPLVNKYRDLKSEVSVSVSDDVGGIVVSNLIDRQSNTTSNGISSHDARDQVLGLDLDNTGNHGSIARM